ncbi:MAG: HaeIII family restriction endonuclease [Bacteroidales bacterium]|nr:HaeIII family restriction endonuclease [Bacteroidales bacterium]
MPENTEQVKNGKAFEFALATQYAEALSSLHISTQMVKNRAYEIARKCYQSRTEEAQEKFDRAAINTIGSLLKLEPGLRFKGEEEHPLLISMAEDAEGQYGDVRDVVFRRLHPAWEIGFSAKNNHEAVKHSRLSSDIDFGDSWIGYPCSDTYWREVIPIFSWLRELKEKKVKWSQLQDKGQVVYLPILEAFRKELLHLNQTQPYVPERLIKYLIGRYPFYKIIKDDNHNLVVVKAFNLDNLLGKSVGNLRPEFKVPKINYPTRIIEFELKASSRTTLNMVLDNGWEISFRIHSASTIVEPSLKFDIQLIGNPPVLFTQHLFQ